jgi:hypothetical protein
LLRTPQATWRARDTWSLRFLHDAFPADAVLCTDKARAAVARCVLTPFWRSTCPDAARCAVLCAQAPYRASDEPAAQTLRVALQARGAARDVALSSSRHTHTPICSRAPQAMIGCVRVCVPF